MKDFKGKIAFITGGTSGAGFGQAQIFSEAGMKVVIAGRSQKHIDESMAYFNEKNADVHAIKLDVTDREAFAAAADEVEKVYGAPPDLLVLTAGVNAFGPAEASTYDDFDWVMGVNLGGVVNGLVTFVPRMIKSGAQGYIAATASWGAFCAGAISAPYTAAKAAVVNLMECYYNALKPYNIGVSVFCPANLKSNIHESALNRPDSFKNTGYNVNKDTQDFYATILKSGMEPRVAAEWLKKGIENEQFIIIPFESGPRMLELQQSRLIDYASPEGMKRLAEKEKLPPTEEELRFMSEREGYEIKPGVNPNVFKTDVGVGMAKEGIDWVDPSKKK